ncbi:MAG TPA: hypothetical protein VHZ55_04920 [Bryobacteraceae bacterium]|nr:hypothetical protein [Bryobacteraceae bacterium]
MKTENVGSQVSDGDSVNNSMDDTQSSSGSTIAGMVDSAKQVAGDALEQAKSQATTHADQHRQTLVSGIQTVAQAFHSVGNELGNKGEGPVARYAAEMGKAIGGQVEQVANYLRDRDIHQLISETEDFARRSPAVFLGGAFVLGLATSRFLKSSRPSTGGTSQGSQSAEPNMQSPQLALPAPTTSSSSTGASVPAGYPFTSAESSGAQPVGNANAQTNTPGTGNAAGL